MAYHLDHCPWLQLQDQAKPKINKHKKWFSINLSFFFLDKCYIIVSSWAPPWITTTTITWYNEGWWKYIHVVFVTFPIQPFELFLFRTRRVQIESLNLWKISKMHYMRICKVLLYYLLRNLWLYRMPFEHFLETFQSNPITSHWMFRRAPVKENIRVIHYFTFSFKCITIDQKKKKLNHHSRHHSFLLLVQYLNFSQRPYFWLRLLHQQYPPKRTKINDFNIILLWLKFI